MIGREVVILPGAQDDLNEIFDWIADRATVDVALRFVQRVEDYVEGFDLASKRGAQRDDVRPGLRIVGFERRLTIAFVVTDTQVRILRVFRSGRDWSSDFG